MISIQPRENFTLVRQLADHTDPSTYYVQAVIRNSIDGTIIATVKLDDKGSGRFTKNWEAPSDVSGLGFYIDITISVYEDSGYTTKASSYGDENEEYLIFDRIRGINGSGGSGPDVDYKKIEKILTASIKPLLGLKNADLAPVLAQIKGVLMEVQAIEIPEPEKLDNTPVMKAIAISHKEIVKAVADKPVTPETDLSEVMQKLDNLGTKEPNLEMVYAKISDFRTAMEQFIKDLSDKDGKIDDTAKGKLAKLASGVLPILSEFLPESNGDKKDRIASLID